MKKPSLSTVTQSIKPPNDKEENLSLQRLAMVRDVPTTESESPPELEVPSAKPQTDLHYVNDLMEHVINESCTPTPSGTTSDTVSGTLMIEQRTSPYNLRAKLDSISPTSLHKTL